MLGKTQSVSVYMVTYINPAVPEDVVTHILPDTIKLCNTQPIVVCKDATRSLLNKTRKCVLLVDSLEVEVILHSMQKT